MLIQNELKCISYLKENIDRTLQKIALAMSVQRFDKDGKNKHGWCGAKKIWHDIRNSR